MVLSLLQHAGLEILQNTYRAELANRIVTRTKEWLDIIFPVIEDKAEEGRQLAEQAS
jgi:hypothetical protein